MRDFLRRLNGDAVGASSRITQMVDGTGTTSWGYDAASDVTSLNTPQGNMSYAYDNDGRRTSLTDGAGSFVYKYNGASEMTGVTNPESQATTLGYDADGRLTSTTFSNGTVESTTYDSRGRTVAQETKTSSNGILYNESDVYDGAGNLSSKTVNSNVTSYGYDADNQITSETGPNYSEGFTYDGNHNRLTQTLNGVVNTYHYGAADVLNSISVNGNTVKSFGYDGAGRTTSITTNSGTTTLGYDYENRVTSLSTTGGVNDTFSYNGLDTRVGKVDANGSHSFRRDGASVTDPVLNDGTSEYTPGISQTSEAGTTFNASDRMGSNVLQTNSSQSQTASSQYDAFGNLVSNSGAQAGPFGFNGQYGYQTDSDTNLQLLGHRYYDPTTGRFLTRDPAKDGTNWYDYVANNPLRHCDPTGEDISDWTKLLIFLLSTIKFPGGGNSGPKPPSTGSGLTPVVHPVDGKHWQKPGPKGPGGDQKPLNPMRVGRGARQGNGTSTGTGIDWGKVGEVAGGILLGVVVVVVVVTAPEVAIPVIACAAAG